MFKYIALVFVIVFLSTSAQADMIGISYSNDLGSYISIAHGNPHILHRTQSHSNECGHYHYVYNGVRDVLYRGQGHVVHQSAHGDRHIRHAIGHGQAIHHHYKQQHDLLDDDDEGERVYQASLQLKRFLDDYADSGQASTAAEFQRELNSLQYSWGVEFNIGEIVSVFVKQGLLTG